MTDEVHYQRRVLEGNAVRILLIASTNIAASYMSLTLVTFVPLDLSKELLAASSALLGISAATLVFFSDYVEKTTTSMFDKRAIIKEKGSLEEMLRDFPRLVFLQFILFWSVLALGASAIIIAASLYFANLSVANVISLALFFDGLLTIILWMSLFVLSSTPGKWMYIALKGESTPSNSSSTLGRKGIRLASRVRETMETLVNVATLLGSVYALYVMWLFLSTPTRIVVTTNGIWIQGIPLSWIISSIVLMSLRSALVGSRALWQSVKRRA